MLLEQDWTAKSKRYKHILKLYFEKEAIVVATKTAYYPPSYYYSLSES